ncbi:GGDEF domain-containing protein [Vibrio sp. PP-XX7]
MTLPDILLIGDILRPSLYQSFKYPANIVALLGFGLTGIVWYLTRQTCRKWQKQSLAQTIIDPLTNLPNRKGFNLLIRQLFRKPGSPPPFQSILLINLDQFTPSESALRHPGR